MATQPQSGTTPSPQATQAPTLSDSEVKKLGTELSLPTLSASGDISEISSSEILALLDDFGDEPTSSNLSLEQYRRLERDSKVAACLQIRTSAVVNRDTLIVPGGANEIDLKAMDFIRDQLLSSDGRSGLIDKFAAPMLHQGMLLGYAIAEVLWKRDDQGQIVIDDVLVRDIDRFEFRRPSTPQKGALLHHRHHLYFDSPTEKTSNAPLPDRRFFCFTFGTRIGNPYGLGLGLKLWYLVYFKRRAYKFWHDYANRFGDPVAYMSIDTEKLISKNQSEIDEYMASAKKFIEGLRRGTTAVIPEWMTPQLIEPMRSATIEVYKGLIDAHDAAISEVILGNINAGASQGLSGAPAGNDESIRMEIARADSEVFHGQLNNTIVRWLTELNFPGAKPPQVWRDFSISEPLSDRAQRDSTLLQLGYRISPEAVAKIYGPDYIDTEAESTEAQSPLAAWMASRNTNNDTDNSLNAATAQDAGTEGEKAEGESVEGEATIEPEPEFAEPDDFEGMAIGDIAQLIKLDPAVLFTEYEDGAISALEFGVSPREAGMRRVYRTAARWVNRR